MLFCDVWAVVVFLIDSTVLVYLCIDGFDLCGNVVEEFSSTGCFFSSKLTLSRFSIDATIWVSVCIAAIGLRDLLVAGSSFGRVLTSLQQTANPSVPGFWQPYRCIAGKQVCLIGNVIDIRRRLPSWLIFCPMNRPRSTILSPFRRWRSSRLPFRRSRFLRL